MDDCWNSFVSSSSKWMEVAVKSTYVTKVSSSAFILILVHRPETNSQHLKMQFVSMNKGPAK